MTMHLNETDKRNLAIGGVIIGVIVVIALLHGARAGTSQTPSLVSEQNPGIGNAAGSQYPGLDLPGLENPSIVNGGYTFPNGGDTTIAGNNFAPMPAIPSSNVTINNGLGSTQPCGCGCSEGDNGTLMADQNALVNSYNASLGDIVTNYGNALNSAIPSYLSQFVNNVAGYNSALAAQSELLA